MRGHRHHSSPPRLWPQYLTMNYKQKQIDQLCSAIARMRCENQCEIGNCKNTNPETHHILFGSKKVDPRGYDPDMRAMLCSFHHQRAEFAPHVSRETFISVYLGEMEDRGRASKIQEILDQAIQSP